MKDVYSQLSRRITEAEHRGDLRLLLAEMHRHARAEPRRLSNEEFNKLATEEAQRRGEINEREDQRRQVAYRRGPAPDFEYAPVSQAAALGLAGTTVTNRCRCGAHLVFEAEPREHETAIYLECKQCGHVERVS